MPVGRRVLAVVEMHMATAMRVGRVYSQKGMAPADFLDVNQEAVGRFREEGRNLRQVGLILRFLAWGIGTTKAHYGQDRDGAQGQDNLSRFITLEDGQEVQAYLMQVKPWFARRLGRRWA